MPDVPANSVLGGGFCLPDLGEGLAAAEIVAWHVDVGDHVVADQPLVTVETDKAVVEIPAPQAGRVARLNGSVGDRINVGEVLIWFESLEADSPPRPTAVAGKLPGAPAPSRKTAATAVKASPRARRRARELGVDLASLEPTETHGIIDVTAVEAAAQADAGEPLTGVRRAMAERMALAHTRVARASVTGTNRS